VTELLAAMTIAEKVSLLAGASMWTTPPIERLGIPAIKVTDGPNGARGGGGFVGGSVTSACFPVAISLASTWNPALVERIGAELAEEAKSKGARLLLAPTVNIHRSPLNGRNFECYSEDPYLSGRIAVAYITGLQANGIGATVKHYVCNDSEFERNTISSEVDERTMREIYLPPFEAAIREAGSWAIMSAYNKINGVYASENHTTLIDILKEEWGFDGIVMSDWFGTRSTVEAAEHGLDLEMPGPPIWRGEKLLAAVEAGQVSMAAIDESVRRMLTIIERSGAFESPEIPEERSNDSPEQRALLRAAAAEGMVLLKNERNVLPLNPEKLGVIAVIGPNARTAQIMGGGSAQVNANYSVSPFDGIQVALGDQVELRYAIGCTNHKQMPSLDSRMLTSSAGEGMAISYFNNLELAGEPVHHARGGAEIVWLGHVAPGIESTNFSARFEATFTPTESGLHNLSLTSAGRTRLFIDDQLTIDNWTSQTRGDSYFGTGSSEVVARVPLQSGQAYQLRLEYSASGTSLLGGLRLGYLPPITDESINEAAELAAGADVAVVFVGLNGDWESEGHDRADMELVGRQNELVAKVAAANPNTVVVLQTGSPITMPWLDQVAAVVQAWFPGQECGNAISDVLRGVVNPSGKLTQTFPMRLADNPAYINYPGENGRVRYGEGIFVGYRYYEKKQVAPLFPFGFGLSYTTFAYSNFALNTSSIAPGEEIVATIDITNTGERAGAEVVQLYVRDPQARVARPEKELKRFAKVQLNPGETRTVTFSLGQAELAFWDDLKHQWVAEAGEFVILIGASSQDIKAHASFTLSKTVAFGGPVQPKQVLNLSTSVRELVANEAAAAILEKHLPGFAAQAGMAIGMGLNLVQVAGFSQGAIPDAVLQLIEQDLASLG
jgi:beta-glucosidase